ncbi:hypothetical protein KI387_005480, partial [Taxus chinensis]
VSGEMELVEMVDSFLGGEGDEHDSSIREGADEVGSSVGRGACARISSMEGTGGNWGMV